MSINYPVYESPTHFDKETKKTICNFCNKEALTNRDDYLDPYTYYCTCNEAKKNTKKWIWE